MARHTAKSHKIRKVEILVIQSANCMDADIHMIQNEKIDEISKVINEDFERLLELQTTNEESVVF